MLCETLDNFLRSMREQGFKVTCISLEDDEQVRKLMSKVWRETQANAPFLPGTIDPKMEGAYAIYEGVEVRAL